MSFQPPHGGEQEVCYSTFVHTAFVAPQVS
jgi:hypothetical protein